MPTQKKASGPGEKDVKKSFRSVILSSLQTCSVIVKVLNDDSVVVSREDRTTDSVVEIFQLSDLDVLRHHTIGADCQNTEYLHLFNLQWWNKWFIVSKK